MSSTSSTTRRPRSKRADGDASGQAAAGQNRLLRVDDEVQDDLLQLGQHRHHRLRGRVLDLQLDVLGLETTLSKLRDGGDDLAQLDGAAAPGC